MNMYTKKCKTCNEEKYLAYFYARSKLNDVCQDCNKNKNKERRKGKDEIGNTYNFGGYYNTVTRKAMKRHE